MKRPPNPRQFLARLARHVTRAAFQAGCHQSGGAFRLSVESAVSIALAKRLDEVDEVLQVLAAWSVEDADAIFDPDFVPAFVRLFRSKQVKACLNRWGAISGFPRPPSAMLRATKLARCRVPEESGVYFFWQSRVIEYVGMASSLASRLTRSHHAIRPSDRVSWIKWPCRDIRRAERFYINVLQPIRNYQS